MVRLGGNSTLYLKLVRKFVDESSGSAKKLKELFDNSNVADAKIEAHTMKSVAGNLGAEKLSNISKELDVNLKAGGDEYTPELIAKYDEEIDIVLKSFSKILSEAQEDDTKEGTVEVSESLIKDIKKIAELYDEDLSVAMEMADKISMPEQYKSDWDKIKDALDSFDTDEAGALTIELIHKLES
jgi:HPt (histidine-containing phosphotransfer) domain-containing protein